MDLIACISLYFKCFFDHITKKQNSYALAFEGLIQSHSYRLGSSAHSDYLIGLRCKQEFDKGVLSHPYSFLSLLTG